MANLPPPVLDERGRQQLLDEDDALALERLEVGGVHGAPLRVVPGPGLVRGSCAPRPTATWAPTCQVRYYVWHSTPIHDSVTSGAGSVMEAFIFTRFLEKF